MIEPSRCLRQSALGGRVTISRKGFDDHVVREIPAVLDPSWVHAALAPYYSSLGWPSIDPVVMVRMLIVGYVFAIRPSDCSAGRSRS